MCAISYCCRVACGEVPVNFGIVLFLCFANSSNSVGRFYSPKDGSYGEIVKARQVRDVESIQKQAKEQSDGLTKVLRVGIIVCVIIALIIIVFIALHCANVIKQRSMSLNDAQSSSGQETTPKAKRRLPKMNRTSSAYSSASSDEEEEDRHFIDMRKIERPQKKVK